MIDPETAKIVDFQIVSNDQKPFRFTGCTYKELFASFIEFLGNPHDFQNAYKINQSLLPRNNLNLKRNIICFLLTLTKELNYSIMILVSFIVFIDIDI